MATLPELKVELRRKAAELGSSELQPLSASQYAAGFEIIAQSQGARATFQDFISPQLSSVISDLLKSRLQISVLEIGPGPRSALGDLPRYMRERVGAYTAFQPNKRFASSLEQWLSPTGSERPLPCLEHPPSIKRVPFDEKAKFDNGGKRILFDLVLFYKAVRTAIHHARGLLVDQDVRKWMIVVFHSGESCDFGDLVCWRSRSFPTGVIDVADDDQVIDSFASFIAGSALDVPGDNAICLEWRKICRAASRTEKSRPKHLLFSAPNIMLTFTPDSTCLRELMARVPHVAAGDRPIVDAQAREQHPAGIVRPTSVEHIQDCVRWALKQGISLTVIGGSRSGHCLRTGVLALDMSAFELMDIVKVGAIGLSGPGTLLVAGAGCQTGDIIGTAMAAGLTVPLGARPGVGAGQWLQGGICHSSRLHGLACDEIVGVVFIEVRASARVVWVGYVPEQYRPTGAYTPPDADDLLRAMKGAGTNFGIVVSVVFNTWVAPTFRVHTWALTWASDVKDQWNLDAQRMMRHFDVVVASKLPRNCSADMSLYQGEDKLDEEKRTERKLFFDITVVELIVGEATTPPLIPFDNTFLGLPPNTKTVNSLELLEIKFFGETSSFQRCLFLKNLDAIRDKLLAALDEGNRPSRLCYIHLLQGGGRIVDVADGATAFGCRDWDFACVITGVWPSDQDSTRLSRACIDWVYQTVADLLSFSCGVYGADLGPDPRDAELAAKAFGSNRPRLARIKDVWDPTSVLAYACPLPKPPKPALRQKLVILVTGRHCAGKDYCAAIWSDIAAKAFPSKGMVKHTGIIGNAIKREFAESIGAELKDFSNRTFKEQHQNGLRRFFREKLLQQPNLQGENFLDVVNTWESSKVLFITGMQDPTPVASFSHLVPDWKVVEVRVEADEGIRSTRPGWVQSKNDENDSVIGDGGCPDLIFNNDSKTAAARFAKERLSPLFQKDIQRLSDMVFCTPDFPRAGLEFRDVLGISQQPGALDLCTNLMQQRLVGDSVYDTTLVSCEAGGVVFASALAARMKKPLALIREAGKLPPPTVSVAKASSHVSASTSGGSGKRSIEIGRHAIRKEASVVVIDDVLASGETLCSVLQLLELLMDTRVKNGKVRVMVVAEFPVHGGRKLLRERGFGSVHIESLLVFPGE